jgi:hypothetical protein
MRVGVVPQEHQGLVLIQAAAAISGGPAVAGCSATRAIDRLTTLGSVTRRLRDSFRLVRELPQRHARSRGSQAPAMSSGGVGPPPAASTAAWALDDADRLPFASDRLRATECS